ncbi:MAG: hypothetical protein M1829_003236 [Trizodia sp. TS-e1964]|nr:MAG: hypothetical protein M1829_003236 [Trizodia sp. TS-e1964]
MATTPPPRSRRAKTPPAPLHGPKYDSYEPYPVRKSTRLFTQRSDRDAQTPPPTSSAQVEVTPLKPSRSAKPSSFIRKPSHVFSPPPSAQSSPQKRSTGSSGTRENWANSSVLSNDGITSAALALGVGLNGPASDTPRHNASVFLTAGMLPTPVKTPHKRAIKPIAGLNSTARILFPVRGDTDEELMPTPKKKGRKGQKYSGFSLEGSSDNEDGNPEIQIYTDSKDRIPQLDQSPDNPFITKPDLEAHITRETSTTSKHRKIEMPDGANVDLEDTLGREDGAVYLFRGKKTFRKFADMKRENGLGRDVVESDETQNTSHHFTRSSLKPRTLFETDAQREIRHAALAAAASLAQADREAEEAITDIEDPSAHTGLDADGQDHIMEDAEPLVKSPVSPRTKQSFSASTPPQSNRMTRASSRRAALNDPQLSPEHSEQSPSTAKASKDTGKSSPFDGWKRTKSTNGSSSKSKKRGGEAMEKNQGSFSKKSKGNVN